MTTEPISDEWLEELEADPDFTEAEAAVVIKRLARELQRLRAIPPDVLAAMERFRRHELHGTPVSDNPDDGTYQSPFYVFPRETNTKSPWNHEAIWADKHLLAMAFLSHHGKDGA